MGTQHTSKPASRACEAETNMVMVSVAERLRGYIRCPSCRKEFTVSHTTKSKILPRHKRPA